MSQMIDFVICSCQAALKQFSDLGTYFLPVPMAGDDIRILSLNNLFIPLIKLREENQKYLPGVNFAFTRAWVSVVHCLYAHGRKLWKTKAQFREASRAPPLRSCTHPEMDTH